MTDDLDDIERLHREFIKNLMSEAARTMGKKGGRSKSPKKLAAIRENAKKGGRPKKNPEGGEHEGS